VLTTAVNSTLRSTSVMVVKIVDVEVILTVFVVVDAVTVCLFLKLVHSGNWGCMVFPNPNPGVIVTVVVELARYELQSELAIICCAEDPVARTCRRQLSAAQSRFSSPEARVSSSRRARAPPSSARTFMVMLSRL
jgi:hypothetical protein